MESPQGDRWPRFLFMALIAVLPALVVGPFWQRSFGITFLVVSLALVAMDIRAGRLREERHRITVNQVTSADGVAQWPVATEVCCWGAIQA